MIQARVPTLPTPTTLRAACDVAKALQQMFAIALQRAPVAADHAPRERFDIAAVGEVLDRHDQRRVADDPRLTVDDRR